MELVKAGRIEARVEEAVMRAVALGAARARARKECIVASDQMNMQMGRCIKRDRR